MTATSPPGAELLLGEAVFIAAETEC